MKINICDPCKKLDNKVVETNKIMRVRNKRELNMDVCPTHGAELKNAPMVDYVRYAYKVNRGIDLSDQSNEQITDNFLRR